MVKFTKTDLINKLNLKIKVAESMLESEKKDLQYILNSPFKNDISVTRLTVSIRFRESEIYMLKELLGTVL